MEANRMELDPSDQELEGSPIAGEISSVNHRSPSSSAPPTEGKVQLSDEQKAKKKIYDHTHREKKKRQEGNMMDQLESLEKIIGELERGNDELKWERDHLEVKVEEENRRILSQLLDNNAGQNTEININGESSMRLKDQREMNQVPITSCTFSRENPSMNPQTLPQSAKKKRKIINEAPERIKILQEKIVEFHKNNAVFSAEARLLGKTLAILGNISAQMTSNTARKNAWLEKFINDNMLQNSGHGSTPFNIQLQNSGQGSTPFNTQLQNSGHGSTPFNTQLQNSGHGSTPFNTQLQNSGHGSTSFNTQLQNSGQGSTPFNTQLQNSGQGSTPFNSQLLKSSHGSTSFNTQLQLPFEMTEFGTGATGLPLHHPPEGPAIEESLGLLQSHLPQGLAHVQLPSGMIPDNTFSTGEAGLPVHHPPNYQYGTTMESGGPTIENPLGLPQSHVPQGYWARVIQGLLLDDVTFSLSDFSCFDNE